MGWCINCHRTTKVDFPDSAGNGNKFYSIYERFTIIWQQVRWIALRLKTLGGLSVRNVTINWESVGVW